MKLKKGVKKILIIILILLLVAALGYGALKIYNKFGSNKVAKKPEVINTIKEYGYNLDDNATKLYSNLFTQLKEVLQEEEVNEEEYAKLVAQMLVVDFYNIDNKMSKNDIGGVEFILEDYKENFILEASNTVYKYVEHNIYNDRKQTLPKVKSVVVQNVKNISYKYKDLVDEKAYEVVVSLEYETDLSYPKTVTVRMIHNGKKLEVFYMK